MLNGQHRGREKGCHIVQNPDPMGTVVKSDQPEMVRILGGDDTVLSHLFSGSPMDSELAYP